MSADVNLGVHHHAFTRREAHYDATDTLISAAEFQHDALNPARSVILEACAGSGKTWLLVSRILRLLLAGVTPQHILALTFTRKAAQEMRLRLLSELELWATADDASVLRSLQQRALSPEQAQAQLMQARSLYETVLNAPRGVTLETFHGWFARVLRHAPLSSGIASDFTLLESTGRWVDKAWQDFSYKLQQPAYQAHHNAFAQLLQLIGSFQTQKLLIDMLHRRAEWWMYCGGATATRQQAGITAVLNHLRSLAAHQGVVLSDAAPLPCRLNAPLQQALESLRDILHATPLNDTMLKLQHALEAWLKRHACSADTILDERAFENLYLIFFTQSENTPRKILSSAWTKKLGGLLERYQECLEKILNTLAQIQQQQLEWDTLQLNQHALLCGSLLIDCYQQQKAELGSLDFNDLEWHLHQLMHSNEHAAYLQTRLDARYKQILIDEFQDTNPLQWGILNAWLEAYGDDATRPQLFIVGDPKQSIYRFRRAEPKLFATVTRQLQQSHGAVYLRTNQTRRNSRCVVDVLNTVLPAHPLYQTQTTLNPEAGGFVLLPQIPAQALEPSKETGDSAQEPLWRDALTTPRPDEARDERYQEGLAVATQLHALLPQLQVEEGGHKRNAGYADVMILVPRRSHLAEYERALRACGIPFISDRSGGLLNTLEASDFKALLTWLSAPYQNLALAQLLRSPLFDCRDTDLQWLAQQAVTFSATTGTTDWWKTLQHLAPHSDISSTLRVAAQQLTDWLQHAGILPVHDLLDRIYHQSQALARYVARNPASAASQIQANLQQFLLLALTLDAGRYPSLPGFLDELEQLERASQQESPDEGVTICANAVRILTVHGAKGLEAPIVVVMDSAASSREEHLGVLLEWPAEAAQPSHFSLYLSSRRRGLAQQALLAQEEQLEQQENWNLLYVALTRAEQWLLISSTAARNHNTQSNWYQILQTAHSLSATPPEPAEAAITLAQEKIPRTISDFQPKPLAIGARAPHDKSSAMRLGSAWHYALEQAQIRHPEIHASPTITLPAASTLSHLFALSTIEAEQALAAAQHVLTAPALARFFNPMCYQSAHNEMDLITADGALKRMDRWVVFSDECWILDYKWQVAESELPSYSDQLKTYAAALRLQASARHGTPTSATAQRPIRCALITHRAELIEIKGF